MPSGRLLVETHKAQLYSFDPWSLSFSEKTGDDGTKTTQSQIHPQTVRANGLSGSESPNRCKVRS